MRCVRALGCEPRGWDLLGYSFGGFVALELNKLHPGELTRIVASCTDGSEAPPPDDPPGPLDGLAGGGREDRGRLRARERHEAGAVARRVARPARLPPRRPGGSRTAARALAA